jgi:hypothetical protein
MMQSTSTQFLDKTSDEPRDGGDSHDKAVEHSFTSEEASHAHPSLEAQYPKIGPAAQDGNGPSSPQPSEPPSNDFEAVNLIPAVPTFGPPPSGGTNGTTTELTAEMDGDLMKEQLVKSEASLT